MRWQVRATGAALEVAAAGYDVVEEVARRAAGLTRVVDGAVTGLTVADVRAARPDGLSAVARRVEDHRLAVVEVLEVVLRGRGVALSGSRAAPLSPSRWSGPAATAAGDRFSVLADELTRLAADLGVCCQALSHAALRMRAAADLLQRAGSRADERGARVTETGSLVVPTRVPSGDPAVDGHEARADALMREEVTAYLRQAERVATQTDLELARHLVASARARGPAPAAHEEC